MCKKWLLPIPSHWSDLYEIWLLLQRGLCVMYTAINTMKEYCVEVIYLLFLSACQSKNCRITSISKMHGLILMKQNISKSATFCNGDCLLSHCLILDSLLHQIVSHFSLYLKCLCANPISIPCLFCCWESCKVVFMHKECVLLQRQFLFHTFLEINTLNLTGLANIKDKVKQLHWCICPGNPETM